MLSVLWPHDFIPQTGLAVRGSYSFERAGRGLCSCHANDVAAVSQSEPHDFTLVSRLSLVSLALLLWPRDCALVSHLSPLSPVLWLASPLSDKPPLCASSFLFVTLLSERLRCLRARQKPSMALC